MNDEELHIKFQEVVEKVNNHEKPFPADILLKLYAYYKIANKNYNNPASKKPLINAFKANALFQAKDISEREAKENYIRLAEEYLNNQMK